MAAFDWKEVRRRPRRRPRTGRRAVVIGLYHDEPDVPDLLYRVEFSSVPTPEAVQRVLPEIKRRVRRWLRAFSTRLARMAALEPRVSNAFERLPGDQKYRVKLLIVDFEETVTPV